MSAGIETSNDSNAASPEAYGDFVFIEDSPDFKPCIYRSYWRAPDLSTPNGEPFAHSVHAFVSTRRRHHSTAKMKQCRSHIVMLFPPAGKTHDSDKDPAQVARTSCGEVPVLCTPRGWQPLAGNIAQVQTNSSVCQLQIIQENATHCGDGLEFMRNHHDACTAIPRVASRCGSPEHLRVLLLAIFRGHAVGAAAQSY